MPALIPIKAVVDNPEPDNNNESQNNGDFQINSGGVYTSHQEAHSKNLQINAVLHYNEPKVAHNLEEGQIKQPRIMTDQNMDNQHSQRENTIDSSGIIGEVSAWNQNNGAAKSVQNNLHMI